MVVLVVGFGSLGRARRRLRRRGHRHVPHHHAPVPRRGPRALGRAGAGWTGRSAARVFGSSTCAFFARQPGEGHPRRVAAAGHRDRCLHGADHLAARARDRHAPTARPRRARCASSSRRPADRAAGAPGARHGGVPEPDTGTTPLALRANVEHNHVLHEHVLIVSVGAGGRAARRRRERLPSDDLGHTDDGIMHLTARCGFQDDARPPGRRRAAAGRRAGVRRAGRDARLVLPVAGRTAPDAAPTMSRWRKALFVVLAHNAGDPPSSSPCPATARSSWAPTSTSELRMGGRRSAEGFDELALLVGQVREQRVGQQVDGGAQRGERRPVGADEADQRRSTRSSTSWMTSCSSSSRSITGRQPGSARAQVREQSGPRCVWWVVTTRQYDSQ